MNTESDPQDSPNPAKHDDMEKSRREYLINFRNGLWEAIRHKENGIWQFVSLFAAAILVVTGLVQDGRALADLGLVNLSLLNLIILLISFWGAIIILEANFWQSRNLWLISNIEWEFLGKSGIGTIIPASYSTPNFRYSELYSVHLQIILAIITFLLLGEGAFIFSQDEILLSGEKLVIAFLVVTLSAILVYLPFRDKQWVKDYYQVRSGAFGNRENFKNYEEYNKVKNQLISPVTRWVYKLTILSSALFLTLAINNFAKIPNLPGFVSVIFLSALILIGAYYANEYFLIRPRIEMCDKLIRIGHEEGQIMSDKSFTILRTLSRVINVIINSLLMISTGSWLIILLQNLYALPLH